jgi:hypothetical protein
MHFGSITGKHFGSGTGFGFGSNAKWNTKVKKSKMRDLTFYETMLI